MRPNRFDGFCDACSVHVAAGGGALTGLPGQWRTWCLACSPQPPERGAHDGWHRLPLASLDLETTGVDPHGDRVVSYALLDEPGFEITGLVNPGVPIPAAAAAVHGITDAMVAAAPPPADALAVVLDWVDTLVQRRVGLVVFNACYDLTMLRAEAVRHSLPQPDWDRLLVVDPYVVDWGIERGQLGQRRLVDVAAYYGVSVDGAHDATVDARAAREVAVELAARHAEVGGTPLEDLMTHQRAWYADRAADWNSYARRVGRELDDPDGWPLTG
ncbi:exonuclease domain-containing protein [Aeromicrobium sp. CF4.19]|uniref:exonuclease domain-containing protein n=1 Tax=Aeromicrobium sp. CF4.19 TaxID=3373082 RepID=UPI003EE6A438